MQKNDKLVNKSYKKWETSVKKDTNQLKKWQTSDKSGKKFQISEIKTERKWKFKWQNVTN